MASGGVIITKLGGDEPPANSYSVGAGDTRTAVDGAPNPFIPLTGGGKRRRRARSTKTFPKGILRKTSKHVVAKIRPTRNPSKSDTRKVRLATDKGLAKTRKRAHEKAAKMPIAEMKKELIKRRILAVDSKIPPTELRILYRTSVGAGLL